MVAAAGYKQQDSDVHIWQCFPVPPGGSQGFPGPEKICYPSSELWVCSKISSQLAMPWRRPKAGTQETALSDAHTTSTGSFWCEGAAALLWPPSKCPNTSPCLRLPCYWAFTCCWNKPLSLKIMFLSLYNYDFIQYGLSTSSYIWVLVREKKEVLVVPSSECSPWSFCNQKKRLKLCQNKFKDTKHTFRLLITAALSSEYHFGG